jgi:hypothetical protein
MKKGLSFDDVCRLALTMPGTARSTSYGTPSLKVDGKFLGRIKEDGETMVLRMDIVSRDLVIKAQPKLFFITDHYRGYPAVLIRLGEVRENEMRELLDDAWRLTASPKRLRESAKPEGVARTATRARKSAKKK